MKKYPWVMWAVGASAAVGMLITAGTAFATVPTLSQSNVVVGIGQSVTITSTNGTSVYLGLNSSPTVATVSINGTQVTITGSSLGSTSINLCGVGTASDCTTLAVTVQATSASSNISFNPSSLSLSVGNNQSVTVSGGNGTYSIQSNTNASVVSTNLSGTQITVTALAAGGATISVCDTSNTCGTFSVTVNSTSTSSASGLTFSQNNISLAAGSSQAVTISGGNGSYHISNISNPSVISAGMNGNQVTPYATTAGGGTITVCDSTNTTCGALTITSTGSAPGQAVVFSNANPTLAVGQSMSVTVSGVASSYVIFANQNADIAQASTTNGLNISIYGASAGTDTLTVCATGGAGCAPLQITVTAPTTAVTTPAPTVTQTPVTTTPTPVTVVAPTPTVQSASVAANTTLLAEIQTLQNAVTQVLTQIQSIQSQLGQLTAQVNAGSGSSVGASANVPAAANVASGSSYNFTELLTIGSQDAQVTALQERLTALGFYSGDITGYYGSATQSAVMKYQTSHGFSATGSVGPATRAALNAGK